jgi:hypothetical protein
MQPEQIPAGPLTHLNLAAQGIDAEFQITDNWRDIVARSSRLKKIYPGLRVNVVVGGAAATKFDANDVDFSTRLSRE